MKAWINAVDFTSWSFLNFLPTEAKIIMIKWFLMYTGENN